MRASRPITVLLTTAMLLASCSDEPAEPDGAGTGPAPKLPPPSSRMIPTVNVATAVGWPQGAKPLAAQGLSVEAFARNLDHPRWMYVLPNGDILVAETNAPPRDTGSLKGWIMSYFMARAGAGGASPDRISLLRDADNDGLAEHKSTLLQGLKSPFGIVLVNDTLYVANTDSVVRYPYVTGATVIDQAGETLAGLPAGPINHHWTKNLVASADGRKLYVSVGSNSNVAENGMEAETSRAAILEIDRSTGSIRNFASGLRNPVGMAFHPQTGELWTVVNERDELGNDLVPDFLTSVKDGGFYGWPYSYFGSNVDLRVEPQRPELVAAAIVPDYALGSHTASLGLTFYDRDLLPQQFKGGAFIGQHGSWNREPRSGYRVTFVPFSNGRPSGEMQDILTGFITINDDAQGRPVGVVVDTTGALLVADDVGNTIWRVTAASQAGAENTR